MIPYSFYLRLDVEAISYEDAEVKLQEALDAMEDVPGEIYVVPGLSRGQAGKEEK